jgi:hypothetical protein
MNTKTVTIISIGPAGTFVSVLTVCAHCGQVLSSTHICIRN